jgi:hypothetical protein
MHCKPFAVALLTLLFTTNHVKGQFNALGSWNSLGVPDYLIIPNNEVTSDFLEFIKMWLPDFFHYYVLSPRISATSANA